ncbi:MAG: undecaprenyl-diphosphate phosphatase [Metallibacterium sp.]
MSVFNVLLIALLQGLTELFPVSSLGHAVVLPALLHLHINQHARDFLPFLVVLHVGTLLALLAYFWRVWLGIAWGVLRGRRAGDAENYRRLAGMLVLGTLPAIILGFALEKPLRVLFGEPWVAALFLIVNGGMLLLGERLRRRAVGSAASTTQDEHLDGLRWLDALIIGVWQCLAFIPGLSRSGATMVGGLRRGLNHAQAARFSFLLGAPVITGAAVLEIPKLLHARGAHHAPLGLMLLAGAVAGLTALFSTWFLMRYFRRHEQAALNPFAWYCIGFGALALLLLRA